MEPAQRVYDAMVSSLPDRRSKTTSFSSTGSRSSSPTNLKHRSKSPDRHRPSRSAADRSKSTESSRRSRARTPKRAAAREGAGGGGGKSAVPAKSKSPTKSPARTAQQLKPLKATAPLAMKRPAKSPAPAKTEPQQLDHAKGGSITIPGQVLDTVPTTNHKPLPAEVTSITRSEEFHEKIVEKEHITGKITRTEMTIEPTHSQNAAEIEDKNLVSSEPEAAYSNVVIQESHFSTSTSEQVPRESPIIAEIKEEKPDKFHKEPAPETESYSRVEMESSYITSAAVPTNEPVHSEPKWREMINEPKSPESPIISKHDDFNSHTEMESSYHKEPVHEEPKSPGIASPKHYDFHSHAEIGSSYHEDAPALHDQPLASAVDDEFQRHEEHHYGAIAPEHANLHQEEHDEKPGDLINTETYSHVVTEVSYSTGAIAPNEEEEANNNNAESLETALAPSGEHSHSDGEGKVNWSSPRAEDVPMAVTQLASPIKQISQDENEDIAEISAQPGHPVGEEEILVAKHENVGADASDSESRRRSPSDSDNDFKRHTEEAIKNGSEPEQAAQNYSDEDFEQSDFSGSAKIDAVSAARGEPAESGENIDRVTIQEFGHDISSSDHPDFAPDHGGDPVLIQPPQDPDFLHKNDDNDDMSSPRTDEEMNTTDSEHYDVKTGTTSYSYEKRLDLTDQGDQLQFSPQVLSPSPREDDNFNPVDMEGKSSPENAAQPHPKVDPMTDSFHDGYFGDTDTNAPQIDREGNYIERVETSTYGGTQDTVDLSAVQPEVDTYGMEIINLQYNEPTFALDTSASLASSARVRNASGSSASSRSSSSSSSHSSRSKHSQF